MSTSNTNQRRTGFGTRGSYVPQQYGNRGGSATGSNRILVKGSANDIARNQARRQSTAVNKQLTTAAQHQQFQHTHRMQQNQYTQHSYNTPPPGYGTFYPQASQQRQPHQHHQAMQQQQQQQQQQAVRQPATASLTSAAAAAAATAAAAAAEDEDEQETEELDLSQTQDISPPSSTILSPTAATNDNEAAAMVQETVMSPEDKEKQAEHEDKLHALDNKLETLEGVAKEYHQSGNEVEVIFGDANKLTTEAAQANISNIEMYMQLRSWLVTMDQAAKTSAIMVQPATPMDT